MIQKIVNPEPVFKKSQQRIRLPQEGGIRRVLNHIPASTIR